jgi:hypothetical protein
MKTPNLRRLYPQLQAMPHYLPAANTVSVERAEQIAEMFGDTFQDLMREFKDANDYGIAPRTSIVGGQFSNAERLFFSYVYDLHYQAACESRESARHEFQD